MRFLAPFVFLAAISCPRQHPAPTQTPTPTPVPQAHLNVDGSNFVGPDGKPFMLLGAASCCTETYVNPPSEGNPALDDGWPLVNEKFLRRLAENKANWTVMRLGPFLRINGDGTRGGPAAYAEMVDGKYDLNRWDPAFWRTVREALQIAQDLGIFVQVDAGPDGWALKHGGETSPWAGYRNFQGEDYASCETLRKPPAQRILDWTKQVVEQTGEFWAVTYSLGNENFACGVEPAYELGIAGIIRTTEAQHGFVRHMIGTNSQRADLEASFDFIERHASEAQETSSRPVLVDEYDVDSLSPHAFSVEVGAAIRRGTMFMLWRGQQDETEWAQSLAFIKQVRESGPPAIPESCPPWVQTKIGIHSVLGWDGRLIPEKKPERDGWVIVDSTPFFDSPTQGRGKCNGEGDVCQGRRCEPKRGLVWHKVSGPDVSWQVENPGPDQGFQLTVGGLARKGKTPMGAGDYVFEGCPAPGATDQENPPKPLDTGPWACSRVKWSVP